MRTQKTSITRSVPPECAKAIDDYLGYRKTSGEKITDDNAPVIRERFDRMDIENTAKKKPEPVATRGISEILYILLTKSGLTQVTHSMELQHLKKGSERKAVKRAHGYRKFFNTNLIRAKVNIAIKELLLGLIAKKLISLGISIQLPLL